MIKVSQKSSDKIVVQNRLGCDLDGYLSWRKGADFRFSYHSILDTFSQEFETNCEKLLET